MDNSEIKQMLTEYSLDPDNYEVNSYFGKDNIWKILDIQRYEPSHSAFLNWFFSQKIDQYSQVRNLLSLLIQKANERITKTGWNDTQDMSDFVATILTGAYSIKSVSATTELCVNKISNIKYTDKIDIFIRCDISVCDIKGNETDKTLEIIIENKVDSQEGEEKLCKLKDTSKIVEEYEKLSQTERYYYAISKERNNRQINNVDYQLFVFLTPYGAEIASKDYILITYQDLVDCVFENFLKRKDINPDVMGLVESYLHNIGNPYNKKNKEIIAMTKEERDLLVRFYNRNRELFDATLKAMINKAEEDGEDEDVKNLTKSRDALKSVGKRRRYTINKTGEYTNLQVIKEFVNQKLDEGVTIADIKKKYKKHLISDNANDVKKGSNGKKPHSFEHNGTTYYVTTELSDGDNPAYNFRKFRETVNTEEKDFQIDEIKQSTE